MAKMTVETNRRSRDRGVRRSTPEAKSPYKIGKSHRRARSLEIFSDDVEAPPRYTLLTNGRSTIGSSPSQVGSPELGSASHKDERDQENAKLKQELKELQGATLYMKKDYLRTVLKMGDVKMRLKAENAELKQKLEDVEAANVCLKKDYIKSTSKAGDSRAKLKSTKTKLKNSKAKLKQSKEKPKNS